MTDAKAIAREAPVWTCQLRAQDRTCPFDCGHACTDYGLCLKQGRHVLARASGQALAG